jgi:hypothetical protein
MKGSKQVCHSGKWKVSGFACLIFSAQTWKNGVKLDKDKL